MKPARKIINMDYRHQTAQTFGLFAEPHWPRDDETLVSDTFNRHDSRVKFYDHEDKPDRNTPMRQHRHSLVYEGRRMG